MADDPVDSVAPWTVKALPVRTREKIATAARREGLTVGAWIEKRVDEWEAAGSPVPVAVEPAAPIDLGGLAQLMAEVRNTAAAAEVPVPPQLARDAMATLRHAMRQGRGLAVAAPRRKPAAIASPKEGAAGK